MVDALQHKVAALMGSTEIRLYVGRESGRSADPVEEAHMRYAGGAGASTSSVASFFFTLHF